MIRHFLFVLAACLVLSGFATAKEKPKPVFVESADQTLQPPPADKAQIVFLEPINSIQGMFPVFLFTIQDDTKNLIATTGAHSKAAVLVTPGKHLFMANHSAMNAHFLEAEVEAGKRYYVLLRFIYANGFQLRPIRTTGPSDYSITNKKFNDWINKTKFVDKTVDSDIWYETYSAAVNESQAKGWGKWLAKTPEERAELTLTPQDAIDF
jgi:hypothetical protein